MHPNTDDHPSDLRVAGGPLRMVRDREKCYVTGFGLWIPVDSEEQAREVITELESQGYRICW